MAAKKRKRKTSQRKTSRKKAQATGKKDGQAAAKKKKTSKTRKKSKAAPREKGAQKSSARGRKKADAQPRPKGGEAPPADAFPIVAVGASAGGLDALEVFFANVTADSGMAFVVVTHQHPGHTSLLPDILGRSTTLPVVQATDGVRVEPDHVYVGPPGEHLAMLDGSLHLMGAPEQGAPRLPIDHFFRSLADDQGDRAICVVLSGTGTDGTLGLKEIKGASGMAMVQEVKSAAYAGMPSSAIATGLADYVLPPEKMPAQLLAYARGPYLRPGLRAVERPQIPTQPLQKILLVLRGRTGHDFSLYKESTIRRRIERRMNVNAIKDPAEYARYLRENPHETDLLFKELLISVTSFFRDPDAFAALARGPLPDLLKSCPENYTFRVWVPGCSSGEEAYSLAILLRECAEKAGAQLDFQLFGTDLDGEAIEAARVGRYPDGIAVDVSPQRLRRYFSREDGTYRIRKEIREMAVFAVQNVVKDPPFTKLDLVSCRNLLIYLKSDLQKRLLPLFHYALKPDGLLFLGPSETVSGMSDLFETVDGKWKIFRRTRTVAPRGLPEIPMEPGKAAEGELAAAVPSRREPREAHMSLHVERLLIDRFAPASVVVNDRGEIFYIHGRTGAYLEPSTGQPRLNLLEMARAGLQAVLPAALRAAVAEGREIVRKNIRVQANGESTRVDLIVRKISDPEAIRGLLLVTFRPVPSPEPAPQEPKAPQVAAGDDATEELQRELAHTKESLQTTIEELETSNEELKSSNEELQSTNEELQSTNEELETSKEEMQSLNEELTTVNAELESKVEELSRANDDMQNLLNSTDIATVFLDNDLRIKRYTDEAASLIKLIHTDVGRPLADLQSNLQYDRLVDDCREVLESLAHQETEVRTRDGAAYLMRIMPYRTAENVIDGLVVTFVNISRIKQFEILSEEARAYFESIVNTLREPLVVLDDELRVVHANRSFYQTFRLRPRQVEGERIYEIGGEEWDLPALRELLEQILPSNETFENFEVEHSFRKIGHRVFLLNARRLQQAPGLPGKILLVMEDATHQ